MLFAGSIGNSPLSPDALCRSRRSNLYSTPLPFRDAQ